jgi:hypothetical protein
LIPSISMLSSHARLPAVTQGLVPHLTPHGVVGQPVDLLGQATGIESLDSLDDAGVEHATSLLEQLPIGHLVGEGVLEGVGMFGEQARLIQKLGGLQVGQAMLENRLGQRSNGVQ